MTQSEMLALVRKLINDEQATGFTESRTLEDAGGTVELLNYLDRAVHAYSRRLADAKELRLMKRMIVINGAALPEDFISFCGAVPISIEGGLISFYGEDDSFDGNTVRYFARLPLVTSYTENQEMPYTNEDCIIISALAAIYALNKMEFDVSQNLMLLGYGGVANTNGNADK